MLVGTSPSGDTIFYDRSRSANVTAGVIDTWMYAVADHPMPFPEGPSIASYVEHLQINCVEPQHWWPFEMVTYSASRALIETQQLLGRVPDSNLNGWPAATSPEREIFGRLCGVRNTWVRQ